MSFPAALFRLHSIPLSSLIKWIYSRNTGTFAPFGKNCTLALLLVSVLLFCSCKTPYQRLGVEGGYTDLNVEHNIYRVNFSGSGLTSPEELSDLALLRCAELTIENGHVYFFLVEERSDTVLADGSITPCTPDPAPLYKNVVYGRMISSMGSRNIYRIDNPRSSYKIMVSDNLSGRHGPVFHAATLFENIKNKYGLDLPKPANKAYKSLTIDQKSLLEKVKQR